VDEAVLRPAQLFLEPARRLAALQAEHAVDRAYFVAARLQQRLHLFALVEAERLLRHRPLADDAPATEDAVAEIRDRERIGGRVVVFESARVVLGAEQSGSA